MAGRHGQTDVVQNFWAVDAIAERDMLESNVTADRRKRRAARIVDRLGRSIEDVAESLDRQARLMKILPGLRQAQHRRTHAAGQQVEGDQLADGEIAVDDQLRPKIENPRRDQLADELHGLACGVTQADDPEARRDIAGKLFLPAPLHLRLERHGLERFDSGHALD
jgi:hypothetical protein